VRDENGKKEMAKQKKRIQKQMWNAMALHVDKPKQNSNGNTNDGNTARRAFAQPKLLAEILGLDEFLIAYFNNILIAISCHLPIDPIKLKKILSENHNTIYVLVSMVSNVGNSP